MQIYKTLDSHARNGVLNWPEEARPRTTLRMVSRGPWSIGIGPD